MSMNVAYQEDSRGIPGIHLVLSLCFAAILHHCLAFRALSPVALHPNLFRVCLKAVQFGLRSEEQLFPYTQNILKPPKTKTCLLDATSNSLATSIGSFLPSLKTQYKTRILTTENKNDHIGPTNPQADQADVQYLPVCPTNSPQFILIPMTSRDSKIFQEDPKDPKDPKGFEAFRSNSCRFRAFIDPEELLRLA